ncbi:uncharacterized protein TNCV_431281 [Trichonephila clavipes]|nr:uncharacterized protein TNCV_4903231 [Trichonephila clavipes]GFT13005.1 uncharacterized protein TNCV_431281 [Trichonephila clavipes]
MQQVVTLVKKRLESLTESFVRYCLKNEDPRHGNMWIIDPFAAKIQDNNLSMHLRESLIHLSSDETPKFKFHSSLSRSQFWLSIKSEVAYPFLSEQAIKILRFNSPQLIYVKRHFLVTAIKTWYRSQLEINAVRLTVTTLDPNIHNSNTLLKIIKGYCGFRWILWLGNFSAD